MVRRVHAFPVELAANAFEVLLCARIHQASDSAIADACGDVRGATRRALAVLFNVPDDVTCARLSS